MFLFRIAHELGMTVSELGEKMTATEYSEWIAYFKIINTERGD